MKSSLRLANNSFSPEEENFSYVKLDARLARCGKALSHTGFRVLTVLRSFSYGYHPGLTRLGEYCGMDRKTLIKAIAELERAGLIRVDRKPRRRSRYSPRPVSDWALKNLPEPRKTRGKFPPVSEEGEPELGENFHRTRGEIPLESSGKFPPQLDHRIRSLLLDPLDQISPSSYPANLPPEAASVGIEKGKARIPEEARRWINQCKGLV